MSTVSLIILIIIVCKLSVNLSQLSVNELENWQLVLDENHHSNWDDDNKTKKIPRNIFQTVPDKTDISSEIKKNMLKLKHMNPTWYYHLYNDKEILDFIKSKYPEFLSSYLKINPEYGPARADFFRYLIVLEKGGVYLDSKSGIIKPLDDILLPTDTFVYQFSEWEHPKKYIKYFEGKEINQWFIAASAQNPFINIVIKNMIKKINDPQSLQYSGKIDVLRLTGPIMYTNSIAPLLSQYQNRRIMPNSLTLGGFVYNNISKCHIKKSYSTKPHYSNLTTPILYA